MDQKAGGIRSGRVAARLRRRSKTQRKRQPLYRKRNAGLFNRYLVPRKTSLARHHRCINRPLFEYAETTLWKLDECLQSNWLHECPASQPRNHASPAAECLQGDLFSCRRAGGTVEGRPGNNYQLRINGELNVTVVIGRTSPAGASRNQNQWRFGYRSRHKPDLLVVARVDHGSSVVRDYFVLPFIYLPPGTWLTVSGLNYTRLEAFHSNTLAPFYDLCARQPLQAEANA